MFFWNSLAFSMIQQMLAIWSLVPLPFLKPAWTSGSSQFMYCWSLAWRILSITLLACEMSAIVWQFEHSLALPFFGIGMKTDLLPVFKIIILLLYSPSCLCLVLLLKIIINFYINISLVILIIWGSFSSRFLRKIW